MRDHVPGVHIPDAVIDRVSASADQKAEGKQFLVETIRALATIEGVAGVHVMGFRNEKLLAEAIRESGVRSMSRVAASESTALQQRAAV
jgi:5,10-methylenetetrahydrofolate reductase